MTDSDFDREMKYQITMSLVHRFKIGGIISDSEYNEIDTIMLKKYEPIIGTLLSGNAVRKAKGS
jgi:hypothetical protein